MAAHDDGDDNADMYAREVPFELPPRLARRVRADFTAAGCATEVVRLLLRMVVDLGNHEWADADWRGWAERICAAVILVADGDVPRLLEAIDQARVDWRDLLGAADLADGDWAQRLDVLFPEPSEPDIR